jgi:membrane protease YdiL (CAAX protease family)
VFYASVAPRWLPASDTAVAHDARASLRSTAGIVTLAVLAAIGGSVVIGIVLDVLGVPIEEQHSVLEIARRAREGEGWRDAILLSCSALLIAPAAEEVLFRGLLFRRIRAASGRPLAYVLSMLAFAGIHGNVKGFAVYAWLGLCFAVALERSRRVGAAIAVHVANNAFVLANLFFL